MVSIQIFGLQRNSRKPYMTPFFRYAHTLAWFFLTIRRICGKQKIVVFLTEAKGICRMISYPPAKTIF